MAQFCGFLKVKKSVSAKNIDNDTIQKMTSILTNIKLSRFETETIVKDSIIVALGACDTKKSYEISETLIFASDNGKNIVFDGRIYNSAEVAGVLSKIKGVDKARFENMPDELLVLEGFNILGQDIVALLNGTFAFVIACAEKGTLFLARDCFGVKPLFYSSFKNGTFIFSSEIKSILKYPEFQKEFNEIALDNYLSFQYPVPTDTFFKNIYSLKPAHFAWLKGDKLETQRYWEPMFKPDENLSLEESVSLIDKAVNDAVTLQKSKFDDGLSVGSFLSGGVDSSYISSFFKNGKVFTVGFGNNAKYNEITYATELSQSLNQEHHTHIISKEEYFKAVPEMQCYFDQPLADPSCIAMYYAALLAEKHVDVAFSGEGADEFFAGYTIYNEPHSLYYYQKLPEFLRKFLARIVLSLPFFKGKSFIIRGSKSVEKRFIGNAYIFNEKEKAKILKNIPATDPTDVVANSYNRVKNLDDPTKMQYIDINYWCVGDTLLIADRATVASGLEICVPFFDKNVFEVASIIPKKNLITEGTTKYAFRLASQKRLPRESTKRPKLGFPVPIRLWIKEEKHYNKIKKTFLSENANRHFNQKMLIKYLDEHYCDKKDNSRKIWAIYIFLVWHEIYFSEN